MKHRVPEPSNVGRRSSHQFLIRAEPCFSMNCCRLDCAISSGVGCHTNFRQIETRSRRDCARFVNCRATAYRLPQQNWQSGAPALQQRLPAAIRRQIETSFLMNTTLAHQLADYACALRFEDLSKDSRARSKTARYRLVGLRAGRMERGAVRDRAKSRLGFFGESTDRQSSAQITRRRRIGRHSRTAVASAISITTTPISRRNRRIRATIFPPRSRLRRASARLGES